MKDMVGTALHTLLEGSVLERSLGGLAALCRDLI